MDIDSGNKLMITLEGLVKGVFDCLLEIKTDVLSNFPHGI